MRTAHHPRQDTTATALARAHALALRFLDSLPERPVSHVPSPADLALRLRQIDGTVRARWRPERWPTTRR
ncbi:MAG: hypothetical protein E6R00_01215 [Gammaproteobacteria bacterium]|nr:MAG: hypothetical protein E6R00_01215 [Gammaproteobacteria bacterium]